MNSPKHPMKMISVSEDMKSAFVKGVNEMDESAEYFMNTSRRLPLNTDLVQVPPAYPSLRPTSRHILD